MRTDCTIDRKQVYLPNASRLGYGKYKAQFGDLVTFRQGEDRDCLGRVIGRVTNVPMLSDDTTPRLPEYILVAMWLPGHTALFERWIDPKDVSHCEDISGDYGQRMRESLMQFLDPDLGKKESTNTLRRWLYSGYQKISDYIAVLKHSEI